MRRSHIVFLSAAMLMGGFGTTSAEDRYFFRFEKTGLGMATPAPVSKNISAYFIAGLGKEFSEQIPMKAEWEGNNWVIVEGIPPIGISFNPANRTFSGTATQPVRNASVSLVGYDAAGNAEATAIVKFDVYEVPNSAIRVSPYGHTGKFMTETLPLPQDVVVHRWEIINSPPEGVTYNGRFVEGTPARAGAYPILNIGYDYNGNAITAYMGNFTVEDGPTFAFIPDDLRTVQEQPGCAVGYECASWTNERMPEAKHSISEWNKVRYSYEVNGELPTGLRFQQVNAPRPPALKVGRVFGFYDQADVRIKAVDVDGSIGYSNWFKIGSLGPVGLCKPSGNKSQIELGAVLGEAFYGSGYRIPFGEATTGLNVSLKSGALPDGLRLDAANGLLYGAPTRAQEATFTVEATYPASPDFEPVECGPYKVIVSPGKFDLQASSEPSVYRTGDMLDQDFEATGLLVSGYSAELDSDASTLPVGLGFDVAGDKKWKLSGPLNEAGVYEAVVRLRNGDGAEQLASVGFSVVGDLKVAEIPSGRVSVQQFARRAVTDPFYLFSWENAVGAAETEFHGEMNGLGLDEGRLFGGTVLTPGVYGPFTISVTDATNAHAQSAEFHIEVTPREGLKALAAMDQVVFKVNAESAVVPFDVKQEELAATIYELVYTIEPALPDGLRLDAATGTLEGAAASKGEYKGYVITATETGAPGGQSLSSQPFDIKVQDPEPIGDLRIAKLEGNRGGFEISSVDPRSVLLANKDKIVGSVDSVRFLSADPAVPGLNFDAASGTIKGTPSAEFDGQIRIELVDGAGRPGAIIVPVTIYPYPELSSEQSSYTVPRLGTRTDGFAKIDANQGFYKGVQYSLAGTGEKLPEGLVLDQTGVISGRALDPVGSSKNIVVRGTSFANGLSADLPLTIQVGEPDDLVLNFDPEAVTQFNVDRYTHVVVDHAPFNASLYLQGSYVTPLHWSVSAGPKWLSINESTGLLKVVDLVDEVGEFSVNISVKDAEGRSASALTRVRAKSSGYIVATPGPEQFLVRAGETFRTSAQTIGNATAPYRLWTDPEMPETFSFNSATGSVLGRIDEAGTYSWGLFIEDAEQRGFDASKTIKINVRAPLSFQAVLPQTVEAVQYDPAKSVGANFPSPIHTMGTLSYRIDGTVPGSLYYRSQNEDGSVSFTHYDASGQASVTKVAAGQAEQSFVDALPLDRFIFDEQSLSLTGVPSKSGTYPLRLIAYDDYRSTGYQVNGEDATRQSANQAVSSLMTVSVAAKPEVSLEASSSLPRYVIVNEQDVALQIIAKSYAYKIVDWKVNGTLPAGVEYSVSGDTLTFSGKPSVINNYALTVVATDAMGQAKTLPVLLKVIESPEPIKIIASDIKTKIGVSFAMEPPFALAQPLVENAYGKVTFASADAAGFGISVDQSTGAVTGAVQQNGDFVFNISATDETSRITSKAVKVEVVPSLRLFYPSRIEVEQGLGLGQQVSADYAIGAVSYVKGAGIWPEGVSVDPVTGAIVGVATGEEKEYPGLTVVGTDAVGDRQTSNTFTVVVKPLDADPIIQAVTVPTLQVGTAMDAVTPSVVDSVLGLPWKYEGLVFGLNKSLPNGMQFDAATGKISGTPSEAGKFTNFEVNVTAPNGVTTKTVPFTVTVMPRTGITFAEGQKTSYIARQGRAFISEPMVAENTWGTVTWSQVSGPSGLLVNGANGVVSGDPAILVNTGGVVVLQVRDALDRTANFSFGVIKTADLIVTNSTQVLTENVEATLSRPTVSGLLGTATYSYSGLPTGLSMQADGSVTGTPTMGGVYPVTVTVTDSYDNYSTSMTFQVQVIGPQYQRIRWKEWLPHPTSPNCIGYSEIAIWSNGENITAGSTYTVDAADPSYPLKNATDGNTNTLFFMTSATDRSLYVGTPNGKPVTSFTLTFRTDGATVCGPKSWDVQQSSDGTNWTTAWSGSTTVYSGTITSSK